MHTVHTTSAHIERENLPDQEIAKFPGGFNLFRLLSISCTRVWAKIMGNWVGNPCGQVDKSHGNFFDFEYDGSTLLQPVQSLDYTQSHPQIDRPM